MIEESYRQYKPETIRIRLSTPFLARTKCKYCNSAPTIYFYTRNATLWYNPRRIIQQFDSIKKYIKHMAIDHHLYFDAPKYVNSITSLSHHASYKGYRPKLHRTRGVNAIFDTVEYLTCDCGRAVWAFSEKAIQNRPEILCRKARNRFPQKFDF